MAEENQIDRKKKEVREVLGRVFHILRPELAGDSFTQVRPEGKRKTVFVNLWDLCKIMHRSPYHFRGFVLSEFGTGGYFDGQLRLVMCGIFGPKYFDGVLCRYINEYVICSACKSSRTTLPMENGFSFLSCDMCCSGRPVAPFKSEIEKIRRRKMLEQNETSKAVEFLVTI